MLSLVIQIRLNWISQCTGDLYTFQSVSCLQMNYIYLHAFGSFLLCKIYLKFSYFNTLHYLISIPTPYARFKHYSAGEIVMDWLCDVKKAPYENNYLDFQWVKWTSCCFLIIYISINTSKMKCCIWSWLTKSFSILSMRRISLGDTIFLHSPSSCFQRDSEYGVLYCIFMR